MNLGSRGSSDLVSPRSTVLLFLAAGLVTLPAAAQRKLNAPLPHAPQGFVGDVQVSPDGAWAVFTDGGLWSTPVKGDRAPVLLSEPTGGSFSRRFQITSDSARVAFIQSRILKVAPIDGGSTPLWIAEGVDESALTPDGEHLVFTMPGSGGTLALFRSSLDARDEPVAIDASPAGVLQAGFQISPDSRDVVYRIQTSIGRFRLFAAPVDGSEPPHDLGPFTSVGDAQAGFRISADSERVVFLWGQDVQELYSSALEGQPDAVKLNGTLAFHQSVHPDFRLSSDGTAVLFRARLDGRPRIELYRASIAGSTSTRVTPELDHPWGSVRAFELVPGGRRVVYLADQGVLGVFELYSLPADGSAPPVRLNGPLVAEGDVMGFCVSPDGEKVAYRADQEVDGQPELYGVPLSRASAPLRLADSPYDADPPSFLLQFSSDSLHVLFLSRTTGIHPALSEVRIDGSVPARVLAPSLQVSGSDDHGFQLVPGGSDLVCRGALEYEDQFELFRIALEGDEPAQRLSASLFPGALTSQVEDFRITSDGGWAVYYTDDIDGAFAGEPFELPGEVEAVSLDGRRRVRSLYPAGASGAEEFTTILQLETSPDGRWAAIRSQDYDTGAERLYGAPVDGRAATHPLSDEGPDFYLWGFGASDRVVYTEIGWGPAYEVDLYSVPADAGSAPIELTAPLDGGSLAYGFARIDPTGRRVVFYYERGSTRTDLYSAAIDGSGPPVLLNATLDSDNWLDAQISPDGRLVVFTTSHAGGGAYETHSVPIDGSAPPTRLNPSTPFSYAYLRRDGISPDGSRVLFGADLVADGLFDLYSVPIAGGPAVRLNPPLVAGGAIDEARFSPDGARVVYRADQEQDDVFDLFSVSSAGGASPVKLSQPLVAGGDVGGSYQDSFAVTADSARVVYRADAALDERYELWSVPITGGVPIRLNQTLPEGADVLPSFRLSPGGERVLYQANTGDPVVFELFTAATDHIKSARRVNGPLPSGGVLGPRYPEARFEFSLRGDRVLYMASEDSPMSMELFESFLDGRRSRADEPERRSVER